MEMTTRTGIPAIDPLPTWATNNSGMARISTPPVRICALPKAMPSVPSVTIKGGIRAMATRKPLISPQKAPARQSDQRADEK